MYGVVDTEEYVAPSDLATCSRMGFDWVVSNGEVSGVSNGLPPTGGLPLARGREAAKQRILLNPGWGSNCKVAAFVAEKRILVGWLLLFCGFRC